MDNLLQLQDLDLRIEALKAREAEIPKQKSKLEIHRRRLAAEIAEREEACKKLGLEQRDCESDIEGKEAQIQKYDQQLFLVKKNDEYQALVHEMEMLKKQIALKEERIIVIMVELDDAMARLDEDKKRIDAEIAEIASQCAQIDAELERAVQDRKALEARRPPRAQDVDTELLTRYTRIRGSKGTGPGVVPLIGEVCSGCHMRVPPQVINELIAGDKVHACAHCGRILYHPDNYQVPPAGPEDA